MAMITNNYYALEEYVVSFLRDRLDPSFETIWSDLDIHQVTGIFGMELDINELYAGPLMAQCFVGMLEEHARRQGLGGQLDEIQQELAESLLGHIHYYVPPLVHQVSLLGTDTVDTDQIDRYLTFIMAHERRHAFQPYEWLEENCVTGAAMLEDASNADATNAYNGGVAEADANAFAFGVVEGTLSMAQASDLSVVTTEMRQAAIERTTMAA